MRDPGVGQCQIQQDMRQSLEIERKTSPHDPNCEGQGGDMGWPNAGYAGAKKP